MVDAKETLRRLSEKASRLNKSTDETNKIIIAYEQKLAEMNIGIEFWLGDPDEHWADTNPLTISSWKMEWDEETEKLTGRKTASARYLGYCRIGDEWMLAIRELEATTGTDEEGRQEQTIEESRVSKTPLLKASRAIRIKALSTMEDFFQAMERKVDDMLGSIEKGKMFLKSIE